MDWNRIEGNWKQFKGRAKEKWGRLTEGTFPPGAIRWSGSVDVFSKRSSAAVATSREATACQDQARKKVQSPRL